MAHPLGSARNPIHMPTQASQQNLPLSQQQSQADFDKSISDRLQRAGSVSVAIDELSSTQQPRAGPSLPRRSGPPAAFTAAALPTVQKKRLECRPDDPIRTDFQRNMLDAFRSLGRWGLVKAIFAESEDSERRKVKSWQYLYNDMEDETYYMYQLSFLLPDFIIESLIKNTLPHDYFKDQRVRTFVDRHMNINLSEYPGIYVNIVTRAATHVGFRNVMAAPSTNVGEWLTPNEVDRMLAKVEKYVANNQQDFLENTTIDNVFRNVVTTKGLPDRRYASGAPKQTKRWHEWMDAIREEYCTCVATSDADTRFIRCPCEVGWSENIFRRCEDHIGNRDTTPIFGLLNAITRQSRYSGGFEFPQSL